MMNLLKSLSNRDIVLLNVGVMVIIAALTYQVKTQYVQIVNLIDTSNKRVISGQPTPMFKGCMGIMFRMVHTAFNY